MAERIVEGLWDCPYCHATAIGGLTKHCPCCGHPQDADTRFYLGEKKNYLEDELASQYGQGADWQCPFCGSLNRVHYQYCVNCAASKDNSQTDYFQLHPEDSGAESPTPPPDEQANAKQKQKKKSKKKRWIWLSVALFLLVCLIAGCWPETHNATVSATVWTRQINIEAYRTVQESDWSVPQGGRVYDQKTEFSHYEQVFDHYETKTRQVSEQVYDGEDYHTSYSNNGDGTFTEHSYSTPRYRTEWRTETYQEAVYRDEPVYATKYYYEIEKWVVDREEKSTGANRQPYWPEYTLAENERTGFRGEVYIMKFESENETFSASLPLSVWEKYHTGDQVEIQVVAGEVTKVGDEKID